LPRKRKKKRRGRFLKEVDITLKMKDRALLTDLFDRKDFVSGITKKEISEGIAIRFEGRRIQESVPPEDIIKLTVIFAELVVLPIATDLFSNWLYDKLRNRKDVTLEINNSKIEKSKERIAKAISTGIQDKQPRQIYSIVFSLPEFPPNELKLGTRTLSERPIIFDEKELTFPDNKVSFADYDTILSKIRAELFIRDSDINETIAKGKLKHAKPMIDEVKWSEQTKLFFVKLFLSTKPMADGVAIEKIEIQN